MEKKKQFKVTSAPTVRMELRGSGLNQFSVGPDAKLGSGSVRKPTMEESDVHKPRGENTRTVFALINTKQEHKQKCRL